MCSEFCRIPIEVGGFPLGGFGLFFWVWLIVAAWGVWRAARHDGWLSALTASLPTTVIVAAVIWFLPRYFPHGIPIRGYGLMVLLGSLLGIGMAIYRGRQYGIDEERIIGLALAMFAGGIVGARLFYVIEYWDSRICQRDVAGGIDWGGTVKEALSYTEGGLVIYGAFLGSMAAFVWFTRRHHIAAWALADLIAPSLLAGLALGRIGCLLNGCCYGGETDLPWAITFPRSNAPGAISMPYHEQAAQGRFYGFCLRPGQQPTQAPMIASVEADSPAAAAGLQPGAQVVAVNGFKTQYAAQAEQLILEALLDHKPLRLVTADGQERTVAAVTPPSRSHPVHPTQIYSAINAALMAWVLWSFYPFRSRDGQVVTLMLLLYPVARFLLEAIRIDESAVFGTGLSISQNISVVLFVAAVLNWRRLSKSPPRGLAFGPQGSSA